MKWLLKAAALQILSRMPFGKLVYRSLQDICGTLKLDIDACLKQSFKEINHMSLFGPPINNSRVLEIGTGWFPVSSLVLYLLGAKKVFTIDINPWLTRKSLEQTIGSLTNVKIENPIIKNKSEYAKLEKRLKKLKETFYKMNTNEGLRPEELLRKFNIQYLCPCDATMLPLPSNHLEYIFHSSVFEHIEPCILQNIITETFRVLKPGGIHAGFIAVGDHFSSNREISMVNFLKFSSRQWYWIGGSGLAYHNRMRCCDHEKFFRNAGFEILDVYTDTPPESVKALEKMSISPEFRGYSRNELACSSMFIVCKKPMSSASILP